MERSGMIFVSLRGVNQRFWSHLESSEQNTTILSRQSLFQCALEEIIINKRCHFRFKWWYLVE